MAFVIDETLEIDAPVDRVWDVITDLPRYGEWNPFVPECRSSLQPGEPIEMRVRLFGSFTQRQTETVVSIKRGQSFCYGLAPMRSGALASHRCHEVSTAAKDRSRYRSHFELSGWLAPLVRALMGRRLRAGFGAMNRAVKERAERLHRVASELVTHRGGCHCGAVRFEVDAPARLEVHECNCSICRKAGYLHLTVPKSRFRLLSGEDALATYRFNTGVAQHHFCATCGVKSFYVPRSHPDGYSVNARALDPDTVAGMRILPFDGADWEQHADELAPLPEA